MKVLVIGGAGYIGSHVTRELLDNGHTVTVYDNLSSGLEQNLFSEAGFIQDNIQDFLGLLYAMKGMEAVVHLAAFKAAGESMLSPEKYSVNNINGTIQILNAMAECGVKYMIFSSSAAVYGEPQYLPVDEKHTLNPENYYGFTKLEIERFLLWYEKLRALRYASLRYFNAAGYDIKGRITGPEKNPTNLIPVIMEVASGKRLDFSIFGSDYKTPEGTCIRDYVHVNDLARAHVAALDHIVKNNCSITVNLGSEKGISVNEMLEAARRITGKHIPAKNAARRAGDPAVLTASSGLAHSLLGWQAQHSDIDTLLETSWKVYGSL